MKPYEEWPKIMKVTDVAQCLEIPKEDAYLLFNRRDFPLYIPGKRRNRTVARGDLWDFTERKTS